MKIGNEKETRKLTSDNVLSRCFCAVTSLKACWEEGENSDVLL